MLIFFYHIVSIQKADSLKWQNISSKSVSELKKFQFKHGKLCPNIIISIYFPKHFFLSIYSTFIDTDFLASTLGPRALSNADTTPKWQSDINHNNLTVWFKDRYMIHSESLCQRRRLLGLLGEWGLGRTSFLLELLVVRVSEARSLRPLGDYKGSQEKEWQKWELEKNWILRMLFELLSQYTHYPRASVLGFFLVFHLYNRFFLLVKPIWIEFYVFWSKKFPANITLFCLEKIISERKRMEVTRE